MMKIATWNVNSIAIRLEHVLKWITDTKTDVLCLQETKCVDEKFPLEAITDFGYHAAFMGQKSYNGVAILSKHPNERRAEKFSRRRTRFAETSNCGNRSKTFASSTHIFRTARNFGRINSLSNWIGCRDLRKLFDETCDKNSDVLLCGDFNVAPEELDVWSVKAWKGKLHFSKPERAAIHHVKQWGFIDVFRQINGDLQEFSWWNYREGAFPKNQGLRIDHIWTSESLAKKCVGCWIDKEPRTWERPSDHTPVVAEFSKNQKSII